MTQEEKERLEYLRTLGTFNRDQVDDYVELLKKESEPVKKEVSKEEPKKPKK